MTSVDTTNSPKQLLPRHSYTDLSIQWKGIEVDIIVPVHNSSSTIRETVASAMNQVWLIRNEMPDISIYVCCYNDASTDDSWSILQELYSFYEDRREAVVQTCADSDVVAKSTQQSSIPTQLLISSSKPGTAPHGAAYARNRAVMIRETMSETTSTTKNDSVHDTNHFICWLDSDDIMHPTRIYHQVNTMMQFEPNIRSRTLLGATFDRFDTLANTKSSSNGSNMTPHYTQWANQLSIERLYLERFREVTIIQPTWMMCRYRFVNIMQGYLEPPAPSEELTTVDSDEFSEWIQNIPVHSFIATVSTDEHESFHDQSKPWRLIHPGVETPTTIRLAEDLRFFHEHLLLDGRLHRAETTSFPLVSYRHRPGVSQSAQTSRKLIQALRVAAFEKAILSGTISVGNSGCDSWQGKFIVWGAGRDGKDFIKSLSPKSRQRVCCFLDVDDAKIARGFYTNSGCRKKETSNLAQWNIPIVHFALAIKDTMLRMGMYRTWKYGHDNVPIEINEDKSLDSPFFGRIEKRQKLDCSVEVSAIAMSLPQKQSKVAYKERQDPGTKALDLLLIPTLPVVVCVAMYRTNGALERNVQMIGRTEGKDLWHFS